ncbi:MAG: hypothetical protein KAY32_01485 [Candidatus Eisenbacteria sp.]|nr:hypothetical protein [Candidatus Eisenbacteria bacterium]
MRIVLLALVALALVGGGAWAGVPDPDYCTVMDQDLMSNPLLTGFLTDGAFRADGDVTIFIAAYGGTPIGDAEVTIVINAACEMCICDSWVQTAYTNNDPLSPDYGAVTMNMRWGGCCEMAAAATIYAEGTPIRTYDVINSTDWKGDACSAKVDLEDFGEFARNYGSSTSPCQDYTGDGETDLEDFGIFARHYGDECIWTP